MYKCGKVLGYFVIYSIFLLKLHFFDECYGSVLGDYIVLQSLLLGFGVIGFCTSTYLVAFVNPFISFDMKFYEDIYYLIWLLRKMLSLLFKKTYIFIPKIKPHHLQSIQKPPNKKDVLKGYNH